MGIETIRALGTAGREGAMLDAGRGAAWDILSAVLASPDEALLEGEATHAPELWKWRMKAKMSGFERSEEKGGILCGNQDFIVS